MITQELPLVKLVKLMLKLTGKMKFPSRRGRPFVYSPQVIMACLIILVGKKLTVRGLSAFLSSSHPEARALIRTIPFTKPPCRRTFDRRFKQSLLDLPLAMLAVTGFLQTKFRLGVARLSLDNRMFTAIGGVWHKKDRQLGIIPRGLRNLDTTAGWGISAYRGWVYGHALDVITTTGKVVLPVVAVSRSLVTRGNVVARALAGYLPKAKLGVVVADSEYQDQVLGQLLVQTGRRLHTPAKRYPDNLPKVKTYQKRKTTVEPFFERFLQSFGLRYKLDRKGPQAWPYLTTGCLIYQLAVTQNLMAKTPDPLQVTHLIRTL